MSALITKAVPFTWNHERDAEKRVQVEQSLYNSETIQKWKKKVLSLHYLAVAYQSAPQRCPVVGLSLFCLTVRGFFINLIAEPKLAVGWNASPNHQLRMINQSQFGANAYQSDGHACNWQTFCSSQHHILKLWSCEADGNAHNLQLHKQS